MEKETIEVFGDTYRKKMPQSGFTFHLLRGKCDETLSTDESRTCGFNAKYRYVTKDGEILERCGIHVPEGWKKQVEACGPNSGNVVALEQECDSTVKRRIPSGTVRDMMGRTGLPDDLDRLGPCGDRAALALVRDDGHVTTRCRKHARDYWMGIMRRNTPDEGAEEDNGEEAPA